jgi:hypothetical protein
MPEMKPPPTPSSLIAGIGYSEEKEELYVHFHKGGTYLYQGVPLPVYDAMLNAVSAGSFFLRNIKNQYEYVKVV